MKNYERYTSFSKQKYNRKGISYLLLRSQIDKVIIPYIESVKDKNILEVGLGYGYYTEIYMNNNYVEGLDINSQMGEELGIPITNGRADEIALLGKKYNRIYSFCMTEYLNREELKRFINDSIDYVLDDGGIFATTIIVRKGIGWLYTMLATRIRRVNKFSYSYNEINNMLEGRNYRMIKLNSCFGMPFAVLVEVKK